MESARSTNIVISLAAITILIYGMQAAKVLLVPFMLAVLFALIAVRPMIWMQRRHVPSVLAALIIVLVMMLILMLAGALIGTTVASFTDALPGYADRLRTQFADFLAAVTQRFGLDLSLGRLTEVFNPSWAMGLGVNMLNALRGVLTNTFLILFTMVFILLEVSSFPVKMRAAFGTADVSFARFDMFLSNLGRYLGIKTLVSFATGLSAWLVTWAIGLDFALLWGVLAFLLNYVPTIGSIIAAVPAVMLAVVQLGLGPALAVALAYLGISITFGNLIEPRLLGRGVGISPLVVFLSLVFWGWVFGPVGMLLSVPLTMTFKIALESDARTRWIAILLGSEKEAQQALAQPVLAEEDLPLDAE